MKIIEINLVHCDVLNNTGRLEHPKNNGWSNF